MNRVISEKAKDGSSITYKYDVCGNIIQADIITLSGETKTYVYTYDEDNILTDVTDAAGISAKQNHDNDKTCANQFSHVIPLLIIRRC